MSAFDADEKVYILYKEVLNELVKIKPKYWYCGYVDILSEEFIGNLQSSYSRLSEEQRATHSYKYFVLHPIHVIFRKPWDSKIDKLTFLCDYYGNDRHRCWKCASRWVNSYHEKIWIMADNLRSNNLIEEGIFGIIDEMIGVNSDEKGLGCENTCLKLG
jgi:hypothetical protein